MVKEEVDGEAQNVTNPVALLVMLILDDEDHVETRQDRFRQLDVLAEGNRAVVAATNGIGSCNNGTARLKRSDNAGLGDGNGLLLHGFVDRGTVLVVHLVEFVNAADTAVTQDESTTTTV